jgi:hypothetical protein
MTGKSAGQSGRVAPRPGDESQRAGRAGHPAGDRTRRLGLLAVAALAARLVTAAGLGIDAFVHADLASIYAEGGGAINEGVLFRVEAVLAALTAIAVILTGRRLAFLAALVVSASALALMLISRYTDLGTLGPFPDLYDPVWFPEKLWAAFGEGAAALAALTGVIVCGVRGKHEPGR